MSYREEKMKARGGGWEGSTAPFLIFFIIAIFLGIPSGNLRGGGFIGQAKHLPVYSLKTVSSYAKPRLFGVCQH